MSIRIYLAAWGSACVLASGVAFAQQAGSTSGPATGMWNQAPPHKRSRKIKVPLSSARLAPRAPRRNPGLKAGAPVKALAKVLRRSETKTAMRTAYS